MEATNDPEQNQSSKARVYFIIAIALLFIFALVGSVDGSFIYLFGGPIVYFFYLGLRNLPSKESEKNYSEPVEQSNTTASSPFINILKALFNNKQTTTASRTANSTSTQVRSPKRFILVVIVITMFALFLLPTLFSLFSSGENKEDFLYAAEQYYASQSYDSAYVNYARAAEEDPTNDTPFIGLGNSAFDTNRFDSALLAYDKALAINSENPEVQYKRGLIFYYQKKYDQAAQTLTSLFESDPTYFLALQKLGDVYYDQKRYDDALKYYEQAYANGIRNNWICYVTGYLYEEKGNKEKAISLYKEALSYDSAVVDIYSRLGTLLPGTEGNFFRTKATALGQ